MTADWGSAGLRLLCATLLLAWPAAAPAQRPLGTFDQAHTSFGFDLRTRWGLKVEGDFPQYDGEVMVLPDGRHQVRIRLATGAVNVAGSRQYTSIARGEGFFDAARHPFIEFLSEPHRPELARSGGELRGRLSMHAVSRNETFVLAPSTCSRPGLDCDVVAHGSVSRARYGLDGWKMVLADQVRFNLRVRLRDTDI